MTSIQPVNPWTPEMIKKDKELKEKYGQNAHIIPAPVDFTKGGDMFVNNNKIDLVDKKQKKDVKTLLLGAAAVLTALVGTLLAVKYLKKGKLPHNIEDIRGTKPFNGPAPSEVRPNVASGTKSDVEEIVTTVKEEKPIINQGKPDNIKEGSELNSVSEPSTLKPEKSNEIGIEEEVNTADKSEQVLADREVTTVNENILKNDKYIDENKHIAQYLNDGEKVEDSLTKYLNDREKQYLEYCRNEEGCQSPLRPLLNEGKEIKYAINQETGILEIKCGDYAFPSIEFERMPDGKIKLSNCGGKDIDELECQLNEIAERQILSGEGIAEELNSIYDYGFGDKEALLNRIKDYVYDVGGFKECNKVVHFYNGYGNRESVRIIYEGVGCDITENGEILQKVL